MGNLILNENMKIYRRWRTWIMMGLMIGAIVLGSMIEWYYDRQDANPDGWEAQVKQEQKAYKDRLSEPNISDEHIEYYTERLAIIDYRLEHNIQPTSGSMWEGIHESAELIVLITLFTVIVAGDSLAGEFTSGTIKLLLIRPASRLKILLSKYASVLIFGMLLLLILFVVSVLFNGLLYQFKALDLPLVTTDAAGQAVEKNMIANLWQTYLLNGISTIIFVTMAFMISTAFRSSALAIGFSIFALFAGFILLDLLQPYDWSKYVLFANIDLSQYLSGKPYQEGMTPMFSITVLIVHFVIFNLVAWQVFTRRDVAA